MVEKEAILENSIFVEFALEKRQTKEKYQALLRVPGKKEFNMTLQDPISEMITIIRNGLASNKKEVRVYYSKLKAEILKVLKREKFIEDYKKEKNQGKDQIVISLKYLDNNPVISDIRKISKPGRRIYIDKRHVPRVKSGKGKAIISTSKGLLTSEEAKKVGVGGELIIEVW